MIVLRIKNLNFEYKNNNNYYYFIIAIVLYSQLYQNIITRCSLYKNLDGMIITLVPADKSRKVACVLNGTEMLSTKATSSKTNMPSPTLSRMQLTIIFQKKRQHPTCDGSNYSVKIFTAHSTAVWCIPPLHDPCDPYMTHPTPAWPTHPCLYITPPHPSMSHPPLHNLPTPPLHDPPHPCMTHPTPTWPTPPLHDPPHPSPT